MARKKQKTKGNRKKPTHQQARAKTADRYALYQRAVQAPDVDAHFFARVYRSTFGRAGHRLREDFCGTAAVCCEWVKGHRDRVAFGVDLDPEPLDWGRAHNLAPLPEAARERVTLIQGDVRSTDTPSVDIVAAQNFSYCIFETRDELRAYFRRVLEELDHQGVLILDLFGGYESMEDDREEITDYGDFEYIWDQHRFDPITHHGTYKIHFRFPDRSRIRDAFVYEWRLWTIPEVSEVLVEAGFDRADVYWEDTDEETGEGNGYYRRRETGECDPAWNAYIVGVKGASQD